MALSENVRRLSIQTGFSQAIIRRFEDATASEAELRIAVGQHCDLDLLAACPCPICKGGPRVSLKHNGQPMMRSIVAHPLGNPLRERYATLAYAIGPAVQAYNCRSQWALI